MDIKLQTQRLLLSPISLSDLEKIHELHSLPETDRYNTLGIPESIVQTEELIKGWIEKNTNGDANCFTLKIAHVESQEFIGLIALNLGAPKFKIGEVWYKLHSDFWKKGYATEALNKILEFGFRKLGLHRIEAGCAVENLGSIRVLEKVGMTREGRKRQVLPLKQGWSDNFHYAILESDFKNISG
ncbi:GNAT family N-acetyltransferase [Flagellimonas flava]|uniref:Protein N-acetyltransferase, RimJ/RimL family n=1 Tax=Flagellimonas flava TaxID=570519 RepID=A0A1M5HU56_9FLAO|nr:GNAT family protein [Allomuricauda flava]SHG19470.1 Protein N-acetyltransferase, RimJ/RimL family [Allomuricauda flava]